MGGRLLAWLTMGAEMGAGAATFLWANWRARGGGDGLVVCRRRIVDFSQQAREGVRRLCGRGSDVSASSVAAKDAERFHMSVVPSASVSNSRRGDTRALQITRYFLLVRFGGDLVMVYELVAQSAECHLTLRETRPKPASWYKFIVACRSLHHPPRGAVGGGDRARHATARRTRWER